MGAKRFFLFSRFVLSILIFSGATGGTGGTGGKTGATSGGTVGTPGATGGTGGTGGKTGATSGGTVGTPGATGGTGGTGDTAETPSVTSTVDPGRLDPDLKHIEGEAFAYLVRFSQLDTRGQIKGRIIYVDQTIRDSISFFLFNPPLMFCLSGPLRT